jgi:hypothetical protein
MIPELVEAHLLDSPSHLDQGPTVATPRQPQLLLSLLVLSHLFALRIRIDYKALSSTDLL